jgi:hypothetical protein
MRAGIKLVLILIAAILFHGIYYFLAYPGAPGEALFDPFLVSLFLNLMGIPIGIYLEKSDANSTGATWLGFGRLFLTVLFSWAFFFGVHSSLGLLMGKYTANTIKESCELQPIGSGTMPVFSHIPLWSYRMNR